MSYVFESRNLEARGSARDGVGWVVELQIQNFHAEARQKRIYSERHFIIQRQNSSTTNFKLQVKLSFVILEHMRPN